MSVNIRGMQPSKFRGEVQCETDVRVMYGQEVRCHPWPHPRNFVRESTRWQVIADNIEAAMKCLPGAERQACAHLAKVLAYAKHRNVYAVAMEMGDHAELAERQHSFGFGT